MTEIKWMNLKAFAKRYGLSRSKTYQLVNSGQLRAKRIGRLSMIEVASADRMFEMAQDVKDIGVNIQ